MGRWDGMGVNGHSNSNEADADALIERTQTTLVPTLLLSDGCLDFAESYYPVGLICLTRGFFLFRKQPLVKQIRLTGYTVW